MTAPTIAPAREAIKSAIVYPVPAGFNPLLLPAIKTIAKNIIPIAKPLRILPSLLLLLYIIEPTNVPTSIAAHVTVVIDSSLILLFSVSPDAPAIIPRIIIVLTVNAINAFFISFLLIIKKDLPRNSCLYMIF